VRERKDRISISHRVAEHAENDIFYLENNKDKIFISAVSVTLA